MTKKGLEEAIKEKVTSLLEESMEKHWGITVPKIEDDITAKLGSPSLNIYIPPNLSFSAAKKTFKKEFLKRELRMHKGNISHLAKQLGIDRRSVHRTIKDMGIDIDKLRKELESSESYETKFVDDTLRSTLDQYKEIIRPQKMEQMYQEVHSLSRNIAKILPFKEVSWKDAEKEFEKQFLEKALEVNKHNITQTANKIKIRAETLHRKIKKLGIRP
jgi:transcriptional regulator of acetoin/glycerol metabolism